MGSSGLNNNKDKEQQQRPHRSLHKERIRSIFEKHDIDKSGLLSVNELRGALEDAWNDHNNSQHLKTSSSTTTSISEGHIKDILLKLDKDGDNLINPNEFEALFDESQLYQIFRRIDQDGSGNISLEELSDAFANTLGMVIPPQHIQQLLAKVDTNQDGTVTYDEFYQFFHTVPMADLRKIAERWVQLPGIDIGSDLLPPLPSKNSDLPLWQFLLGGGIGGVVSRTVTAPLEVVKLKAQTAASAATTTTTGNYYRGIIQELTSAYQTRGMKSLFAGNGTNCLRIFPHAGIGCLAYSRFVKWLPSDSEFDSMELFWRAMAGTLASCTATAITYPLDTVRVRLTVPVQEGNHHYNGIMDAVSGIGRKEGISAFYKGLQPTLYAVAPFVAIQQATYDVFKQLAMEKLELQPSVSLFMTCGAMAGISAQSVVYPLDLLRRRMQLGIGRSTAAKLSTTSTVAQGRFVDAYIWLALQDIIMQNSSSGKFSWWGIKGLFRGIVPTFLKVMPAVAVSVTVRDAALGRLA